MSSLRIVIASTAAASCQSRCSRNPINFLSPPKFLSCQSSNSYRLPAEQFWRQKHSRRNSSAQQEKKRLSLAPLYGRRRRNDVSFFWMICVRRQRAGLPGSRCVRRKFPSDCDRKTLAGLLRPGFSRPVLSQTGAEKSQLAAGGVLLEAGRRRYAEMYASTVRISARRRAESDCSPGRESVPL